jgi:ethanolamine utilization protein EutA
MSAWAKQKDGKAQSAFLHKCMNKQNANTHSAADHRYGDMAGHVHAPGEDADHDHDGDANLLEHGSQANAETVLISVGADIGSSSTQIAFSRLTMHGPGEPAAMRRHAKSRETLWHSSPVMTPFTPAGEIDIERLRGTFARAFREAGLTPDDIETGAVILTGAAAHRINAARVAEVLASDAGDVVAAAAGDHMEAALCAYGSGAVDVSRAQMKRILNIDIGGATTKFAIADSGRIVSTAAIAVGGRQMSISASNNIERLDVKAQRHAAACGMIWRLGEPASREDIANVANAMASLVLSFARGESIDPQFVLTSEPFATSAIDGVMFSGGVAEYVYGLERRDFGDMGKALGQAIAQQLTNGEWPWPLLDAHQRIRATVLGASEHSVQLSGATSFVSSHAKLLPRRNLPVIQPQFNFSGTFSAADLAQAIAKHRQTLGDNDPAREALYAFRWRSPPDYFRLRAFAEGVAESLKDKLAARCNLYIVVEGDAALTLGSILRDELEIKSELLVIDSIVMRDLDFADLGRIRLPSGMLPVTIKSLLFPGPECVGAQPIGETPTLP